LKDLAAAKVRARVAGFAGTAIANETELSAKSDHSPTDINSNSAAQLGPNQSAVPHRSGDSTALHGSDNSAAQLGSGSNGNPGAQLNKETQATSAPPVDSDSNTGEQPVTTRTDTGIKSHD
jgi:hypothetical protein